MSTLTSQLDCIARRLWWRQVLAVCARALSVLFAIWLILGGIDCLHSLPETFCGAVCDVSFIIVLCHIIRRIKKMRGSLDARKMALLVEQAHPELMDSFVCATELEHKSSPLRPMEQGLLAEVYQKAAGQDLIGSTFQAKLKSPVHVLWGTLSCVLLIVSLSLNATRKSSYANYDWLRGKKTGIAWVDLDKTGEYPRHCDVRVMAQATRWEKELWLELKTSDGTERYPMSMLADSHTHAFMFYDVQEATAYRVGSPSVRSDWMAFSVFDPPEISSVKITVQAPSYTGKAPEVFTDFQDLTVTAGSTLDFELQATTEVTARLVDSQEKLSLPFDGQLTLAFKPLAGGTFRVELTDVDNHSQLSPWFQITVEPDLLPVLEQRLPEGDAKVKAFEYLRLDASASDDFGVRRFGLQYSVNGGPRQLLLFYESDKSQSCEREVEYNQQWDIPKLQLKDGDMLSCFYFVEDNCEPQSQIVRGDMFFVTIYPDEDEIEMDGENGDQKKVSVGDLIAESKRLLRLTWDTLLLPSDSRGRQSAELQRGLKDLNLEIRKRENELKGGKAEIVPESEKKPSDEGNAVMLPEPFNTLFTASILSSGEAVELVDRGLLEESTVSQETALTNLVKIENELLKNAMKSKKGEDKKGKNQENKQDKDRNKSAEQTADQKEDKAKDMKALQESLEQLRQILERQNGINVSASQPDANASGLADKQEALQNDTSQVASRLKAVNEAAVAREKLKQAVEEMRGGAEAFRNHDIRLGGIHGGRARADLVQAVKDLEEALKAAMANQVKQLGEQAEKLGREQRREAQSSQGLQGQSPEQMKEARNRQKDLKDRTGRLKQDIQETANQLDDSYPDVAKMLREAAKSMDKKNIQSSQQRALNALLYKKFDRAAKEQTDAANYLNALSMELSEAADRMPSMSAQELREALAKLQRQAQETNHAQDAEDRQKLEELRQELERDLRNLAKELKDSRLNQYSEALDTSLGESSASEAGQFIMSAIQSSSRILMEHLEKLGREKKLELNRTQVAPPQKYRRQVEDYFKELGE